MNPRSLVSTLFALLALAAPLAPRPALSQTKPAPAAVSAADAACIKCHQDTGKADNVHAAMKDGCVSCHKALDASVTPHKTTNKVKGGVAAKGAEHCYACHDKTAYAKKSRHAALRSCIDCHDPHASPQEKLLTEAPEKLCFKCHEQADFEAKFVHDPVKEGACTGCHDAHASDHPVLLVKAKAQVCLTCHSKVRKSPHVVTSFTGAGHPIGGEKPGLMNPAKPKEPFYCGSCHEPHMSQHARLSRFNPNDAKVGYCQHCHQM